ncbi:MAG: proton-conducting transporter membrane subunit [Hyphomonadaceae bacterium]
MIGAYLDLARAHAPLLMLMLPLLGAAAAMVSPSPRLSWGLASLLLAAASALAGDVAFRFLGAGRIDVANEGVALGFDGVAAITTPIVLLLSALAMIGAAPLLKEFPARVGGLGLVLALCIAGGWTGALLAHDLVGVFVASEAAWLASIGLVALSPNRGALNGAFRMLALGGLSAALFLVGLALLARAGGMLALDGLAIADIASPQAAAAGAALMLLSIAVKAAASPLHLWAPAAYGRAGRFAGIMVGAVGAVGGLAVLVRLAAHTVTMPDIGGGVSIMLAALGVISVAIGSAQAVGALNPLRLAAYAGVAQTGVVLMSVGLGSPQAFAAAFVQIVSFAASGLALFAGFAAGGVRRMEQLDGLGRRAPLAGAAIMAGALSLMGAPLSLGFLGRWRLIEASVGAGWWWAAGAVIFASLAGVFYGGRLIERLYFRRAAATFEGDRSPWRFALAPALLAAIALTAVGFAPGWLLSGANMAAAHAIGGGQ